MKGKKTFLLPQNFYLMQIQTFLSVLCVFPSKFSKVNVKAISKSNCSKKREMFISKVSLSIFVAFTLINNLVSICEIHQGQQVLHLIHDKAATINNVNSNSNLISKA